MTIDPVELERLSKAAKELSYKLGPFKFNIRRQENYSGEHREWNEEFTLPVGALLTEQIVLEALRTGQLAPVQQPSGDVVEAVKDAARYRWLRDHSCPPHNFYISVPDEFHGVKYGPDEVDAYIDAARAALGEKP